LKIFLRFSSIAIRVEAPEHSIASKLAITMMLIRRFD